MIYCYVDMVRDIRGIYVGNRILYSLFIPTRRGRGGMGKQKKRMNSIIIRRSQSCVDETIKTTEFAFCEFKILVKIISLFSISMFAQPASTANLPLLDPVRIGNSDPDPVVRSHKWMHRPKK